MPGNEMSQGCLPQPGWSQKTHGSEPVGFNRLSQGGQSEPESRLPDEIGKLTRSHPLRERSLNPLVGNFRGSEQISSLVRERRVITLRQHFRRIVYATPEDPQTALDHAVSRWYEHSRYGVTMQAKINDMTSAFNDHGLALPSSFSMPFRSIERYGHSKTNASFTVSSDYDRPARAWRKSDAPLCKYPLDRAAMMSVACLIICRSAGHLRRTFHGRLHPIAFYRKYAERIKGSGLANTKAQADTDEAARARVEMARNRRSTGAERDRRHHDSRAAQSGNHPDATESESTRAFNDRGQPNKRHRGGLDGDGGAARSVLLLKQMMCPVQIIVGELDLPTPPSRRQAYGGADS